MLAKYTIARNWCVWSRVLTLARCAMRRYVRPAQPEAPGPVSRRPSWVDWFSVGWQALSPGPFNARRGAPDPPGAAARTSSSLRGGACDNRPDTGRKCQKGNWIPLE